MSAALAAIAAPKANVNAARFQLRMDRENRFKEFMKQVFEIFISIKKMEVESLAGEFIGDRRRRDHRHRHRHRCCDWRSHGCWIVARWHRCSHR
jgi:hypothetical protein